jgi:chemotaxis methyl-accepting protein methylase
MRNAETGRPTIFANSRILRRCLGIYVSQASRVWSHLFCSVRDLPVARAYARHLHRMVLLHADRKQYFATFFLRNRPELRLLNRLCQEKPKDSRVDIAILACSKGAEVYSMAWAIRSARPDLQLNIAAVDISQEILDFASAGIYTIDNTEESTDTNPESLHDVADESKSDETKCEQTKSDQTKSIVWNTLRDQNAPMFERMSSDEIDMMFEVKEGQASIRPFLRQGITWICGDAGSPRLSAAIGPQDIVVANRFLCHMSPVTAAACLRNIAKMVKPGGHLFVSGIDLDVKTRVALEMGWQPVPDLLREIHDGDESIRRGWPAKYWGLEPLDDRRADWRIRYASVFHVRENPVSAHVGHDGTDRAGEAA